MSLAGAGSPSLCRVWLFIIPPSLFSSFPLPLFSYAAGAARQPGSAQPPSVLPPSLSLIPPFSLKTWAPGCSPLRWQQPCLESSPVPSSTCGAAGSVRPSVRLSVPHPPARGAGCGRGRRSQLGSCARGDLPQVSSPWALLPTSGFSSLFLGV